MEVIDKVRIIVLIVLFLLSIGSFFKRFRYSLRHIVVILAVIITILDLISSNWFFAGAWALFALGYFTWSIFFDDNPEENKPDEDPKSEPVVLQIMTVAVNGGPEVPTRKILCSHCGAPNIVAGLSITDCAYCGVPL